MITTESLTGTAMISMSSGFYEPPIFRNSHVAGPCKIQESLLLIASKHACINHQKVQLSSVFLVVEPSEITFLL